MQQHRIISLLSILVMLIIPVIGWFLIAGPQVTAAGLADSQRAEIETQNVASAAAVAQLKADSANLPKLNDELDQLRASIPADVDPSGYIDGLNAIAQVSGVSITNLTVEDAVAYVPATPPVDPAATPPADDSTTTTPTPAPPAPETPGIVTDPLITSDTFVAIPVQVEVSGDSVSVLSFVQALQTKARLFLVTGLNTEPAADASTGIVTSKIDGYIWAIPVGAPGNPHPVSTIVKSMTPPAPPAPPADETDEPDPGETDAPTTP
jgi:Tfp pilus assembly protein PilO